MRKMIFGMLLLLLLSVASMNDVQAQVTIGADAKPDDDAVLDLQSTDKGLLIPRVALDALDSPAPLTGKVAGMIVYNTGDGILKKAGIYYNDGTDWILLRGGTVDASVTSVTGTAPVVSSGGATPAISLAPV